MHGDACMARNSANSITTGVINTYTQAVVPHETELTPLLFDVVLQVMLPRCACNLGH